jgi:hypothetical protein
VTFIFDDELVRRECLMEPAPQPRLAGFLVHGGAPSVAILALPCSQIT